MGSSKRHQRNVKHAPQMRSRTTRSKGKPISDPLQNTKALTQQLRAMGLYAADTLGDGNCLFRALSDQMYGTESQHLVLRREICDWIERHKERYGPFCEDERGLDTHLSCMRQPATYGGHLELSAFAHLMRRDVKVIQPGLVYLIEWASGGADLASSPSASMEHHSPDLSSGDLPLVGIDPREHRRLKREKKREAKEAKSRATAGAVEEDDGDSEKPTSTGHAPPIYVAYHDWEHFSSIRNLKGPHTGLPCVVEAPVPSPDSSLSPPSSPPSKKKPPSKSSSVKPKSSTRPPPSRTRTPATATTAPAPSLPTEPEAGPSTPSHIPLPSTPSRSPSPALSDASSALSEPPASWPPSQPPSSVASTSSVATPFPPSSAASTSTSRGITASSVASTSTGITVSLRSNRSPKRTFDESSGSGSGSHDDDESAAKRSRRLRAPLQPQDNDGGDDHDAMDVIEESPDADTPGLSFSTSPSASSSSAPSPAPSPPSAPSPALTRRERKRLGLPKARVVGANGNGGSGRVLRSAGTIVIPGGRFKKSGLTTSKERDRKEVDDEEWRKNGTGRLDVRGFRELRI
ncbi:hypothetical protein JAAARDRAFT_38335 [Jaapia argillacea MUCL 33604]|uniref:OTU domain-containing protein n=1 Tax=Jaapia argillacea MUCL 33604 TaxID=933084 RepID=A0A067PIB1_9AGAM|nr:hypothetical protein JAAARDRAFT_38335 [Jaapia argillacea MUCL 33604]